MRHGEMGVGGWVMLLAGGLVGCGATAAGGPPEDDARLVHGVEGRSGERLTALSFRAGDAEQFRHFHDELLGFDCQFGVDGEGTPRCFPTKEGPIAYLDSQCREEAIQRYWVKPGEWLVDWDDERACPGALQAHGDAFLVAEQVYAAPRDGVANYQLYERTANGCQPGGGEPKASSPVYRLLRQPASKLVAGRVESFATEAGLRVDRVFAEDGAEANLGVRLADGTACKLQRDGSCLGFAAFQSVAEGCRGSHSSIGMSGAELLDIGTGPLHLETYRLRAAAGVFHVPEQRVGEFLTPRGGYCSVSHAADGSFRCLDEQDQVHETGYYADSTCDTRLYAPNDESIDATGNPRLEELYWIERGIEYRVDGVRGLQAGQRGPLYTVIDAECQLADGFGPPLLLSLGDALELSVLPEVEEARLP
jgi:hypothetical protein